MKFLLILLFAAVSAVILPAADIAYQIPMLTVRRDSGLGRCHRIPFSFTRTDAPSPLRIVIAEDTPDGTSSRLRNCVWLAAVTAALQHNDALAGCSIQVEFSGMHDGPSSGAVLCLAIMSAREGREFPADFAITGTIMPDGTVGVVGGVARKMKAAAEAGVKRICIPAFLRFEEAENGTSTDLFREGKRLGMTVHPVEHIDEAYRFLHNLPQKAEPAPEIVSLSEKVEDVLLGASRRNSAVASDAKKKFNDVFSYYNDTLNFTYQMTDYLGRSSLLRGKLWAADRLSGTEAIFWQALELRSPRLTAVWDKYPALQDDMTPENFKSYLQAMEDLRKTDRDFPPELRYEYTPANAETSPLAAQLEPVDLFAHLYGLYLTCEYFSPKVENPDVYDKKYEAAFAYEQRKIIYSAMMKILREQKTELAALIPSASPDAQAGYVEKLFHSAASAAWLEAIALFNDNNEEDEGEKTGTEDKEEEDDEDEDDGNGYSFWMSVYQDEMQVADKLHKLLETPGRLKNPAYHTVVSMHAQVNSLALSYGFIAEYDDYDTPHLNFLMRTARKQALRSIQECSRQNIPCWSAIRCFEIAEARQGTQEHYEIFDVLVEYWKAHFNAKALLMSFRQ